MPSARSWRAHRSDDHSRKQLHAVHRDGGREFNRLTIATAFGALLLIQGAHQPWTLLAPFAILTAALGVFLAIPMKRQMINQSS